MWYNKLMDTKYRIPGRRDRKKMNKDMNHNKIQEIFSSFNLPLSPDLFLFPIFPCEIIICRSAVDLPSFNSLFIKDGNAPPQHWRGC